LPRTKSASLYASYTKFEKQHGTRTTVEATVWSKRRIQYEDDVSSDPFNYDTWFDFARLEEDALRALRDDGEEEEQLDQAVTRVREVYERAVANVPMANEKRLWRRYIFLWLYYAVFEEIETKVRRLTLHRAISKTPPLLCAARNQSAPIVVAY
jgi:crooked neck